MYGKGIAVMTNYEKILKDITVDTNDLVSEKTVDATPDGVNISTSEPVGHNVDVKL